MKSRLRLPAWSCKKSSYKESTVNVKDKYYELFRWQGGKGLERNEDMEEG